MKAIAIVPGSAGARLVERSEPSIHATDEIKLRVLGVGICGTDREEASGGRALAPAGAKELVIGHEMLGQVVETAPGARRVKQGDYVVLSVRRGCGKCLSCAMNRSDMCLTGDYRERGIWGLDGYQSEYVVESERYAVQVPPELASLAVLAEPLSVAEKAIDEAVRVQTSRLPDAAATPDWLFGRRCLVAGLGPVGLLASLALRLRGAEVDGVDIVDVTTARPRWLAGIGGRYVDGRQVRPDQVDNQLGPMDLIFEATGIASLEFNLLDALCQNGVYVLTGVPGGNRPLEIPGAQLIRQLVLENQVMVGSVNAALDHFQMAVRDLSYARLKWGNHPEALITHRHPYSDFAAAIKGHPADEIKALIEWQPA